jgi:membrane protease YdiL (CAAX protease family)
MQDFEVNSATVSLMATALVLSLAAVFFLFQRHIDGHALLAYEPRRRAPWGPIVLVIPLFFIVSNFLPLAGATDATVDAVAEPVAADQLVYGFLIFSILTIAFVPVVMAWLLASRQANSRDIGLPRNHRQFWADVSHGVVGCLAALLPIMLVNYVLTIIFRPEEIHPLIDQLQNNGSTLMLLVGAVSAVIAAPLFEEFVFRVLLQGWLESVEDERLGFHATERVVAPILDYPEPRPAEPSQIDEAVVEEQPLIRPRHGWLAALPHGWMPILISSVLFGLAHLGHGVAPVPLVLFGIMLGYLYQRTHRIVPCIAAHMLFNAYSMLLLWLNLESAT